jgi:hypothetical protein
MVVFFIKIRASLRSALFFLSAPSLTWNPGSAPGHVAPLEHNILIRVKFLFLLLSAGNLKIKWKSSSH